MRRPSLTHLSLSKRTLLVLVFFLLTILAEMAISDYQTEHIIKPLNQMTDQVQAVSQFLDSTNSTISALAEFRWEYGDSQTLLSTLKKTQEEASRWLALIDRDISHLTRLQYIRASALKAMADSFSSLLSRFSSLMAEGKAQEASHLYYSDIVVCGGYLTEYSQNLINALLQGNQEQSEAIRKLSLRINIAQAWVFVLSVIFGAALFFSVRKTLNVFHSLERASEEISKGDFDVEDIPAVTDKETDRLISTFNNMKRSMKDRVRLLEEKNELENLLEKGKLETLRSQVNPHFLFNTLNIIKLSSEEEGAMRTGSMISALARLFRYSLETEETVVPLSRELVIAEVYAKLCKARFCDKVGFKMEIDPSLDVTVIMVPSFIIQPVVENSFRHGLGPKEDPGMVTVKVARKDGLLVITVSDDGVGMSSEKLSEVRESITEGSQGHIGLYNVACRLRLSAPGAGIEVESGQGTGTRVTLTMSYIEEEADGDDQDTGR